MKIIEIEDSIIGTELILERWPTDAERDVFDEWADTHEVSDFLKINSYRRVSDHTELPYIFPTIQVSARAPEYVKTICILKWS